MNHYVLNPTKTTPTLKVEAEVRDLVAAMPIVIFVKALRAAFQRPAAVRTTLRTSASN